MIWLYELSVKVLVSFILIIAINVSPGGAADILNTETQVQKYEQSTPSDQPASNYKSRPFEQNKADKPQPERIKAGQPGQTKSNKINHGLKKRKLSKHNKAVIRQREAAKKKREMINRINADSVPKQ
jgi:hypothetical protein